MLTRLNAGSFAALEVQWAAQCEGYGDSFDTYATPFIEQARSVACEDPAAANYGVFAINEWDGILHINRARLPGTDGWTLRMLWLLLAPTFDYDDVTPQTIAQIATQLIVGARMLAEGDMPSGQIKFHLASAVDRQFFIAVGAGLVGAGLFSESAVRGNWLHLAM